MRRSGKEETRMNLPLSLISEIQSFTSAHLPELAQINDQLRSIAVGAVRPFVTIAIIVIASLILLRMLRTLVQRTITRIIERGQPPSREVTLKARTLASVAESVGRLVIFAVATMMGLSQLGIDIAPLLASAGVAGIAIGFGAQSLIRDYLGGFFILLEDQFSVGDVINVNGNSGVVEFLSLRRTGLRAIDGTYIIVPNGDIRTVWNLTKDWSRAVLDIDISYDDDIDRAVAVLTEVLDGIQDDPIIGPSILEPAEVLGVEALGPYQVTLRALVKTRPMEQWNVARELRRRIKRALSEAQITIPYPHNITIVRPADPTADEQATAMLAGRDADHGKRAQTQPEGVPPSTG